MNQIAVLIRKRENASMSQKFISAGSPFDVFLVDDESTDGTSEAIKSEFPEVSIIKGDGSLFWNRGMYTASCSPTQHSATVLEPGYVYGMANCCDILRL